MRSIFLILALLSAPALSSAQTVESSVSDSARTLKSNILGAEFGIATAGLYYERMFSPRADNKQVFLRGGLTLVAYYIAISGEVGYVSGRRLFKENGLFSGLGIYDTLKRFHYETSAGLAYVNSGIPVGIVRPFVMRSVSSKGFVFRTSVPLYIGLEPGNFWVFPNLNVSFAFSF